MFFKTKLRNLLILSTESEFNSSHKRLPSTLRQGHFYLKLVSRSFFPQPCMKVIFTSTWALRMITVAQLSRKFIRRIGTSQVTLNPAFGIRKIVRKSNIRPIIVNYSFIVTSPHRKNPPQNVAWKLIIWSRMEKNNFQTIVKNTGSGNTKQDKPYKNR